MSYIGKGIKSVSSANITVDTMVGDGVVNTLALSQSGVESVKDVSVYYQGVAQVPNVDYTLTASTVTFTTIPAVGMKVVAVTKGDSIRDKVNDSSASGTSFADNAITDSKIIGLDASKLTGALPAMDGSALTNASVPTAPLRSSASDPAVDTNGTLGDIFANTTTGQLFVLTDATTDQNVWTNAGNGDGNIIYVIPRYSQGYTYGFIAGGMNNSVGLNINKYTFATDGASADWGDLTIARNATAGSASGTHGYTGAGFGSPDSSGFKQAGVVHEGEYVVPKNVLESQKGGQLVSALESMRMNRPQPSLGIGFANGGFASAPSGVDMVDLENRITKAVTSSIGAIQVVNVATETVGEAVKVNNVQQDATFG